MYIIAINLLRGFVIHVSIKVPIYLCYDIRIPETALLRNKQRNRQLRDKIHKVYISLEADFIGIGLRLNSSSGFQQTKTKMIFPASAHSHHGHARRQKYNECSTTLNTQYYYKTMMVAILVNLVLIYQMDSKQLVCELGGPEGTQTDHKGHNMT
jgi:hypothetical protein